ncbi:ankyrin repeat domain-containing protein [Aspergillus chevalieri]|uniref:Ankyrin repeat-containing domain protein n=1 Tax=Aspergillus chevalieri TaxID=182096 RepID=A0A7R7VDS7_ASPCH|nr:uncharacterized protein ACHE_10350S [Aspergillus chevalieri]BCR82948.1 hypothetical protein ACHE_10350S [Aspergillus chevalieri]
MSIEPTLGHVTNYPRPCSKVANLQIKETTQSPSMLLLDLPTELLWLIGSFLERKSDLNFLSQANRHLHLLFNRVVYDLDVKNSWSCALEWAARNGCEATARKAIDAGASLDSEEYYESKPLTLAVENGDDAFVRLLLEKGANPNDDSYWNWGLNPLTDASMRGYESIVRLLLEHGASQYRPDSAPMTFPALQIYNLPLPSAAGEGHLEIVKLLTGADHEKRFRDLIGPIALTQAAAGGHISVAQHLIEEGVDPNLHEWQGEDDPISWASRQGRLEMVKFLLDKKAEVLPKEQDNLLYPMTLAASRGHYAVAELLVSTYVERITQSGSIEERGTLLAVAVICGWEVTVQRLLEHGCPPDTLSLGYNRMNWDASLTPLARAVENNDYEMIQILLHHGANPNGQGCSELYDSPLFLAITNGYPDIVQCLLDHGAYLSCPEGHTCDHEAMVLLGAIPFKTIFPLLLDRGANPEAITEDHEYPLAQALRSGHIARVQLLLDKGVPLQTPPELKYAPSVLACAVDGGQAMVEFVLAQGFVPQPEETERALYVAARHGNPALLELFLDQATDQGWCPNASVMMEAALEHNIDDAKAMIDLLLDRGVHIDTRDRDNTTLLFKAAELCHHKMVPFLLERGADPISRNGSGSICPLVASAANVTNTSLSVTTCLLEFIEERGIPLQDWEDQLKVIEEATYEPWKDQVTRLLQRLYWRNVYPPPSNMPSDSAKGLKRRRNNSSAGGREVRGRQDA